MEAETPSSRRPTANLRKVIEDRLEEMGLSLRTAEKIAGLPRDAIRGVLRGKSPTYKKLLRIFDALHLQLTIRPIEERETRPNPMTGRPATADTPRRAGINEANTPENVTPSADTHADHHGDEALRKLIRQRLDQLGVAPGSAERVAGMPADTIRGVLRGKSPTYKEFLNVCEALHLEVAIKPIEELETRSTIPARRPVEATDSRATRRQAAKDDVRAAYYTSAPTREIVARLREIPQDIIAEVFDEMFNERAYDDAEELRLMAFDAGHTIY